MKTVKEILQLSITHLENHNIAQPRLQAEEVLSFALEIPRLQLYMEFDRPLTEPELTRAREILKRRSSGEPIQQIRGSVEFLDCKIELTQDVLIPRQETEILAGQIAGQLATEKLDNKQLWDLCSGSGCLGISLKKRYPELSVTLSDLSSEALKIAQKNAKLNKIDVEFLEGDFLQPFSGRKADYLVCNPPYVTESEYTTLDREVREFEPRQALVGGEDGLDFYRKLAEELPNYLNPGAKVWLEIGHQQGESVKLLFSDPKWTRSALSQDWSGNDRFFFLEFE